MDHHTLDLDKMNSILQSTSVAELWQHFLSIQAGYGFDRLFFVSTLFGAISHWGDKDDWLLLTNHHKEIVEGFIEQTLYQDAAKVHFPPDGTPGAYSWRQTQQQDKTETELTTRQRRNRALKKSHAVEHGYSIWFPQVNQRCKAVLGLCARPGLVQNDVDAIWAERGGEIIAYAKVAYLKLASLPHPNMEKRLTPRQIEVLEWVADGKTARDIAEIIGRSQVTVEKHLRQIRTALNVETTAQAVKKMLAFNQLFLVRETAEQDGLAAEPLVSAG